MASRHGHSKSDDPSFAVIARTSGGPSSSSRLPPPPPAPRSPTSPTSSMAFIGNRPASVPHPPYSLPLASSARHDAFTSILSQHPFPESDSMSHVQFSINGGRDRGVGGGNGNGISSEEARWMEANAQRDRLKRWQTWQKCLGAVSALWATYTATRYFVAFVLYADDHDRQVYALTLGTLSACSLFIYGSNAMYAWFDHSPRSLIAIFRLSTYGAALTLVAPAIVNVILTCIWNGAQGSPHNVLGRCNWDLDVIWTGTSGECSASGHDSISFAAWLAGAIVRLVVTLLVLGGFQYTSHVIFQLTGGFCPLAAMIHRSRSHSILPLVGGPGSHRDSESTAHHSSQQQHHANTSVDTVRPNPPLSPPLPPQPSLSSSSPNATTPTRREPRVLLRHDRPPGLGPLPPQPHSPHQQSSPPMMATTDTTVTTPPGPGPLVTPPLSRYIPSLGAGPRYPDPDFGSDSSNPSSPADAYYTPAGGAYGGRYTPSSNGATPTPPATTTRNSSRRSTATSTATSSTAASGTGTGSGSGGHHYYSQPNPNGGSYFPPQQPQQQRPQSPPGSSPTRAQMQEYQFPPSTSAASSPLSPSTPGSAADYAMLQNWATDFRSMVDRVNRETEEGLEMARETGSYQSYDQGRSNGYGNISQSGPSSVMVVGGVVRRMETIESFGSKEVQSIMGNSRPPTAMGMARPNRASKGGLSVDSTATTGRGLGGEREKESP